MLLEFTIQNYRSFKDAHTFSLVAEESKSKPNNVFNQELGNSDNVRLLKSAVIYGANASGKSNFLRALYALQQLITGHITLGSRIKFYEPFLFDRSTAIEPTRFTLSFIVPPPYKVPSICKYVYEVSFNQTNILNEKLDYYPLDQKRNLFERKFIQNEDIHKARIGQDYKNGELKVFNNQTILSKFGLDEPDEHLSSIYKYFRFYIINQTQPYIDATTDFHVIDRVYESSKLKQKLKELIKIVDTKINDVIIKKNEIEPTRDNPFTTEEFELFGEHDVYERNEKVGTIQIPFFEESKGTNIIYMLGAKILRTIGNGGIFLIDEIDTSLHPKLSKFLVLLFQHPVSNPKNAQLIFTTHETTFLDKDLLRKDQIWFVEKDERGQSDLISVQDFEGVREDTAFEKWYMAGKFGGLPNIQEMSFIYDVMKDEE